MRRSDSTFSQVTGVRNKTFMTVDTSEVDRYIAYLKTVDVKRLRTEADILVRNQASDIVRIYKPFVPVRQTTGRTNKYGSTPGNLRKSVKYFRHHPRTSGPYIVKYSVGFKLHNRGELASKVSSGKKWNDGYYGAWVDAGVAGRQDGQSKTRSNVSRGFTDRAKPLANRAIQNGLSVKARARITKKLKRLEDRGRI